MDLFPCSLISAIEVSSIMSPLLFSYLGATVTLLLGLPGYLHPYVCPSGLSTTLLRHIATSGKGLSHPPAQSTPKFPHNVVFSSFAHSHPGPACPACLYKNTSQTWLLWSEGGVIFTLCHPLKPGVLWVWMKTRAGPEIRREIVARPINFPFLFQASISL